MDLETKSIEKLNFQLLNSSLQDLFIWLSGFRLETSALLLLLISCFLLYYVCYFYFFVLFSHRCFSKVYFRSYFSLFLLLFGIYSPYYFTLFGTCSLLLRIFIILDFLIMIFYSCIYVNLHVLFKGCCTNKVYFYHYY